MVVARLSNVLRIGGLAVSALLLVAAVLDLTAQLNRPDMRAAVALLDGARLPDELNTTAASMALNGDIRADVAALAAQRVLLAPAAPDRAAANYAAQAATESALRVSPFNSLMWLGLGMLKAQLNEPAGPALKLSYLTGPLGRDGVVKRVTAVVTTDAVNDEDLAFLAQSDVRTILTKYSQLEPALVAAYRQAGAKGKALMLNATDNIDPQFSRVLRQYP